MGCYHRGGSPAFRIIAAIRERQNLAPIHVSAWLTIDEPPAERRRPTGSAGDSFAGPASGSDLRGRPGAGRRPLAGLQRAVPTGRVLHSQPADLGAWLVRPAPVHRRD